MLVGIVAVSDNFAIGRGGTLPWHYSSDLKFFKATTTGKTVVMGYKTWQSIGRPLPNRLNLVLSRRNQTDESGVILLKHKADVVNVAKYLKDDVFIIGGAQIYDEFADHIDRWIITRIPEIVEDADVFFNNDFLTSFSLSNTSEIGDGLRVDIYDRKPSE
jgi:dihydrofolate reductase